MNSQVFMLWPPEKPLWWNGLPFWLGYIVLMTAKENMSLIRIEKTLTCEIVHVWSPKAYLCINTGELRDSFLQHQISQNLNWFHTLFTFEWHIFNVFKIHQYYNSQTSHKQYPKSEKLVAAYGNWTTGLLFKKRSEWSTFRKRIHFII